MNVRVQVHAILWAAIVVGLPGPPATAQTTPEVSVTAQTPATPPGEASVGRHSATDEITLTGTVVSSSKQSLVLRTQVGFLLFIYDRLTIKPHNIPVGSTVRITSVPTGEQGVRLAESIVIVSAPPPAPAKPPAGAPPPTEAAPTTQAPPAATAAPPEDNVPVSIRRLEKGIERQSRKWGLGVRGGVSLDPETIIVGVHARFGPLFSENISFRPNVEFAWGEVTKLFAINPEVAFRLPFTPRLANWSAYLGTGPSFTFQEENFTRHESVDFSNFSFQAGLNIFAGMEFRSGFFVEAKTTVYASPHFRFLFGYTF